MKLTLADLDLLEEKAQVIIHHCNVYSDGPRIREWAESQRVQLELISLARRGLEVENNGCAGR